MNLIFKNDFEIYALLNRSFDAEGTFVPDELNIRKIIKKNNFEKKDNKFMHYLFEILSFLKRIFLSVFLIPHFIIHKNLINYLKALMSNNFILPRYFIEIYFYLKNEKFNITDHIFFNYEK